MKTILLLFVLVFNIYSVIFSANKKSVTINTTIYPPYVVADSTGEMGGVSCIVAREIFMRAGYTVDFNVVLYPKAVSNLFEKENSVMMGMFMGVPNYKSLDITEVLYTVFPTAYFYNSKMHPEYAQYTDIKQTAKKTVAVMKGTGFYENIITQSGGVIQKVDHESQVLKLVSAGKVDFGHTGLLTGFLNMFTITEYTDIKPTNFLVSTLNSGLMFRKGAYAIKDDFERKVKELKNNGELLDIYRKALENIPLVNPDNLVPEKILINSNEAVRK